MMTPITPTTLMDEGFRPIKRGNVSYFGKYDLYVIYIDCMWYICDINGNIGNTIVVSMEELILEFNKKYRNLSNSDRL